MTAPRPTLRDLLLRSDFGRRNPARVDELLARCADPVTEDRNPPTPSVPRRAATA